MSGKCVTDRYCVLKQAKCNKLALNQVFITFTTNVSDSRQNSCNVTLYMAQWETRFYIEQECAHTVNRLAVSHTCICSDLW